MLSDMLFSSPNIEMMRSGPLSQHGGWEGHRKATEQKPKLKVPWRSPCVAAPGRPSCQNLNPGTLAAV